MKRFLAIIILALFSLNASNATVLFDAREYKPKGKHYTAKINLVYHFHSPMNSEKVILLYFKTDTGRIVYKGIEVSDKLEDKLPRLVIRYIGLNIADVEMKKSHSIEKVKDAVRKAVQKALDQKYKNLLITEGSKLAQDSAYFRGYCNTKWWMPDYYYDYQPAFSTDTINTFLTNQITDTRFPGLKYITDTLKNFNRHHNEKRLSKWGNVFKKVRNTPNERTIRDYGFVKSAINNDNSFHTLSDSCRFTLKKTNVTHGKRYPVFASVSIFGWHATYCNFLASDLRKAVFGTAIWDTKGCKTDYNNLQANLKTNAEFIAVPKEDIYKYVSNGYFVFFIDPTHIATAYPGGEPTEKNNIEYPKIVQAGDYTGIRNLFETWPKFDDANSNVKCYLYLGYLKT